MAPKFDWDRRAFKVLECGEKLKVKAECGEVMEGRLVPGIGPGNFVIQFRGMDETEWRKQQAVKEVALEKARKAAQKEEK